MTIGGRTLKVRRADNADMASCAIAHDAGGAGVVTKIVE
jgi:hypothetical protein